MALTKIDFMLFFVTFFAYPTAFYLWLGYRALILFNKLLENDSANRMSFGVLCSLFMLAIGYLIKLG